MIRNLDYNICIIALQIFALLSQSKFEGNIQVVHPHILSKVLTYNKRLICIIGV